MTNEQKCLGILADCTIGATYDALRARGITDATLDALVADGRLATRVSVMANPKGLEVRWYELPGKARPSAARR